MANVEATVEAMAGVVEAFRFLAARVEALEATLMRMATPLPDMVRLVPVPDIGPWTGSVLDALSSVAVAGPVVHVECGDGSLLRALRGHDVEAWGADPRGELVATAVDNGLPAHLDDAAAALAACAPESLRCVVLSGVIDRLSVDGLVALVALAGERLVPGGALVILARPLQRDADDGWSRLLPGEPLGAGDWETVLVQAGLAVEHLMPSSAVAPSSSALPDGSSTPTVGLLARRPS